MSDLLKYGIGVLVVSAAAMAWGFGYRGDHPMAAVGALFGAEDQTYAFAGYVSGLGVLAFLIGIALLVGGLVQTKKSS